jgi:phosphosulfolactate phosphohydrolase-like enzyme
MVKTYNDYKPETTDLVESLLKAGFTIRKVSDGEEVMPFLDVRQVVATVNSVDESHLYVSDPLGNKATLFIVLGNSPGELVADYSQNEALESVIHDVSKRWEGKPQPTSESYL